MNYVTYYRVSTREQGNSGLGLSAQRRACIDYINRSGGEILAEFQEIESGRKGGRPQLEEALKRCRTSDAVLLIAKLDRLTRDLSFLIQLEKAGVDFAAVDNLGANRLSIRIMVTMAEYEADLISTRTKQALAEAKAMGVILGGMRKNAYEIKDKDRERSAVTRKVGADAYAEMMRDPIAMTSHLSLRKAAKELNDQGYRSRRGGNFGAQTVSALRRRLELNH